MSQTEHARVQALLASGRITEDEAEILFAALDEEVQTPPTDSESTLPVSRETQFTSCSVTARTGTNAPTAPA